jgi:hypothetical protein
MDCLCHLLEHMLRRSTVSTRSAFFAFFGVVAFLAEDVETGKVIVSRNLTVIVNYVYFKYIYI